MSAPFDAKAIEELGWRQGAVLGPDLSRAARECAPAAVTVAETDWLIVTSHDCDVVNERLDKEPVVELLRATILETNRPDKQLVGGRNPRSVHLVVDDGTTSHTLHCKVHDRWLLSREELAKEAPRAYLSDKVRRLLSEWLAKRYIRAAFPSAFDSRWRAKLREWTRFLEGRSSWIQGVYLRLSTHLELPASEAYRCHVIIAAPAKVRGLEGWRDARDAITREAETFWGQFKPGIVLDEVEVLGTDELTLADIERHQRFDADWVSFVDDTDVTPAVVDMGA